LITAGIDVGSTTSKAVLWMGDRMGPYVIATEMYLKRKNQAL
jgi:activator of 2-hydroxyglutaryl-CoA dehydratase